MVHYGKQENGYLVDYHVIIKWHEIHGAFASTRVLSCSLQSIMLMYSHYLKTSWRNLMKNKIFSFINLFGLTIGITVCLLIFLFVINEFSVDRFHKNESRIYRVMRGFENEGKSASVSYVSGMYAPSLLTDFKGDIDKAVRVSVNDNLVTVGNKSFHEKKVYDVDPDFFSLFSFPLLRGDASSVLKDPSSVVLTESIAKKYFGSIDQAMGAVIELDKKLHLKVTGIAKDVAANSHLDFELVVPLENYKDGPVMTTWLSNGVYTYVLLNEHARQKDIESRMPQFVETHFGSDLKKYGFRWNLFLTPLKDIYFETNVFDSTRHGDKTVVYIFLSIAVLILLIACINFMNLSTIRAVDRSKEVGMRKVLGALRSNLIRQFMGESLLLTTIACAASILLVSFSLPLLNQLLGYTLNVSWNTPPIYLFLVAVILIVGLAAGSYPAFVLSAFAPIQALKGRLKLGKGGSAFRQVLVVVQFSISIFLIVGTLIIARQMQYVKSKQLGYNQDQVMVVKVDNADIYKSLMLFKTGLQTQPEVENVSLASGEPGGFFDGYVFDVEDHTEKWNARTEFADFEFVQTLGLHVIAGRDFSPQFPTDSTGSVLINQTAAAKLGWTPGQAIGKWIRNTARDDARRRIVGVVADFNFQSLKENVEPLVIAPNIDRRTILVKLKAGNLQAGIGAVEKEYRKVASAYPFEYRFLDDQFENLYRKDIRQQTILSIFAVLAILVACLGLFGLASFSANKRFKEIGIRKILGSSVGGIVLLLSKDLLKPVIVATFIALPAGYWIMRRWLENFAYQTSLSWWIFCLAALIVFAIAIVTVGIKAVKAAVANPVKSLRTE